MHSTRQRAESRVDTMNEELEYRVGEEGTEKKRKKKKKKKKKRNCSVERSQKCEIAYDCHMFGDDCEISRDEASK